MRAGALILVCMLLFSGLVNGDEAMCINGCKTGMQDLRRLCYFRTDPWHRVLCISVCAMGLSSCITKCATTYVCNEHF